MKQAFGNFVRAKTVPEMQQLGSLISSLIGLSSDERALIDASIERMTPGVLVANSLDSLTINFASVIGLDDVSDSAENSSIEMGAKNGYSTPALKPFKRTDNRTLISDFKSAFFDFVKARSPSDLLKAGRKVSETLELSIEEHNTIEDSITRMTPGVLVANSLDSFASNLVAIVGLDNSSSIEQDRDYDRLALDSAISPVEQLQNNAYFTVRQVLF